MDELQRRDLEDTPVHSEHLTEVHMAAVRIRSVSMRDYYRRLVSQSGARC
jgi:hypothetical protein